MEKKCSGAKLCIQPHKPPEPLDLHQFNTITRSQNLTASEFVRKTRSLIMQALNSSKQCISLLSSGRLNAVNSTASRLGTFQFMFKCMYITLRTELSQHNTPTTNVFAGPARLPPKQALKTPFSQTQLTARRSVISQAGGDNKEPDVKVLLKCRKKISGGGCTPQKKPHLILRLNMRFSQLYTVQHRVWIF